jgi:fructokinase
VFQSKKNLYSMSSENSYICSFGEVLWDMLPSGKLPGGAPMNVAAHLQNLGINAAMISRVGDDALGEEIKAFMAGNNCSTAWVQTDTTHGTGVVQVTLSETNQASYDIVHPISWDFIAPSPLLNDLVAKASAFIYGTLACRDKVARTTLLGLLGYAQLKVYDVNFRAPHYERNIVELLLFKANIVKMNDEELDIIGAWYGLGDAQMADKMRAIKTKFGLTMLVVTEGANGASLLDGTGFYKSNGYAVKVQDTIGSGDSFLAGLLKNYFEGNAPEKMLNYACALGALVATHKGANPPIQEADIFKMMERHV